MSQPIIFIAHQMIIVAGLQAAYGVQLDNFCLDSAE
jgi:hypothetical protein